MQRHTGCMFACIFGLTIWDPSLLAALWAALWAALLAALWAALWAE